MQGDTRTSSNQHEGNRLQLAAPTEEYSVGCELGRAALGKGSNMETSSRFRQHATRWQGPGPGEDVDDTVHEAFNRMCNEMGKQFFPAQWEAFQSYRVWEEAE